MLSVKVNSRRTVFVSLEEDTKPNIGGYYCQIFDDPDKKYRIDHFTINNYSIGNGGDKYKRAVILANDKVKQLFR